MTDTTTTLAFDVTGDPDQLLTRMASAVVEFGSVFWLRRWRLRILLALGTALGVLLMATGSAAGLVFVVYGAAWGWRFGTRAGLESQERRRLRRFSWVGEPRHVAVDGSGVRVTTATSDQRWDWSRVTLLEGYEGGVVIVVDRSVTIDLPPWVLAGERDRVLAQLEGWRGG